jgi:hypothetical protein
VKSCFVMVLAREVAPRRKAKSKTAPSKTESAAPHVVGAEEWATGVERCGACMGKRLPKKAKPRRVIGRFARLSQRERDELLLDLNYLNGGEIKAFCKRHNLPFKIAIENTDGALRGGAGEDRKGVMLRRVRHFLETGSILMQTCYPREVVRLQPPPKILAPADKIYYGQYSKANSALTNLLRELTENRFENGAIARIALAKFWAAGRAPTVREFAKTWQRATQMHKRPNPEWAFLADRANKTAGREWKKMRLAKARKVLGILDSIAP